MLEITGEEKNFFGTQKLSVPRSSIPAVRNIDYSARVQTVHVDTNPLYHAVISKFYEKTGSPILVNTSFNVRGEPILYTPTDAFECFMFTDMDVLAIRNYILIKENQNIELKENYNHQFQLD